MSIVISLLNSRLSMFQRRALPLTAATLDADGGVQQALPGKLFDLADAEGDVLVEVLQNLW